MDKEKQIEEIAKVMCAFYGTEMCYDCRYCMDCHIRKEAERIYNAGYCKASEVAREIFEEIETSLMVESFYGGEVYYAIREDDYLHYKNKYTESENNNE